MLDGTLGVVVGLECLRVHAGSGDGSSERTVELIAFSDEEGRFGGTFGSEAFTGTAHPGKAPDAPATSTASPWRTPCSNRGSTR